MTAGQPVDVAIERLTLRVTGIDPDQVRRLARLVAAGLADQLSASSSASASASLPAMRLNVSADPMTGIDQLARQLVDQLSDRLLTELERSQP